MPKKPQDIIKALYLKGFSETWIAKQAGLSQGSISKIKVGDVKYPRIDTAEKLENLYLKVMGQPHSV